MQPRLREALHQTLTMAALMFVLRVLIGLLPFAWAKQSWSGSFTFALTFGLMWGFLAWVQYPRIQAHREAMERQAKERKKAAQRAR